MGWWRLFDERLTAEAPRRSETNGREDRRGRANMGLHLLAFSQDFDTGLLPTAMNALTDNVLGLSGLTGVYMPHQSWDF